MIHRAICLSPYDVGIEEIEVIMLLRRCMLCGDLIERESIEWNALSVTRFDTHMSLLVAEFLHFCLHAKPQLLASGEMRPFFLHLWA